MALSAKEEYIAQCITTGKTREECEQLWNEAHKGDQETKEEYMKHCVASGKTQEECEKAWSESHAKGDYATLIRDNEMLRVKLRQSIDIIKEQARIIDAANAQKDAVTDARKYELAIEIERDSQGRLKHSDLMKESLENLSLRKSTIDTTRPKDFVSMAQLLDESERKKNPMLTVGEWDPVAKKYKGGR